MGDFPTLSDFAEMIKERNEAKMRCAIEMADDEPDKCNFFGFSPLAIAAMHSDGTWVIEVFGKPDRVNYVADTNLESLSDELALNVDDDIKFDRGYTPISLAVMFGPMESVKMLIEKGSRTDFLTEEKLYSLRDLAEFRRQEDIIKLLNDGMNDEDGFNIQCRNCDTANCVIS